MKKFLSVFLAFIMVLSLAGCKNDQDKALLDDVDHLSKKLEGKTAKEVEKILGKPDSILSGLWGDCYTNSKGNEVVVYYSPEGKVSEIHEFEPVYQKETETVFLPYVNSGTVNPDINVQYIRTNGYNEYAVYPQAFIIDSREGIEEYYEKAKDFYDLERKINPSSDMTIGFLDAADKYDDKFFEDHCLMVVLLEEGSGSVRHEVTGVTVYPSKIDRVAFFIKPVIKRLVPETGTADMAE